MQDLSDTELIDAFLSRQDESGGAVKHEAAFAELVRRHSTLVYRACHRLLKDHHEAKDASQAVFVVLARKAGRLRKGDLAAWLYRVAHHVAAETVRKRMRRSDREQVYAENEVIQMDVSTCDEGADPAVMGLVDAALLSLPERCREAVILQYLQNYREKEAANDAAPSVARQALVGLRRLGWRAVLALDGTAIPLLEKEIANGNQPVSDVCNALALDGNHKALALLAKALDDRLALVRHRAALGLRASLDIPLAMPLFEKALTNSDFMTRSYAAESLGILGKDLSNGQAERMLDLLDKAFPGATLSAGAGDYWLGANVSFAVAQIGGANALAFLENWISDPDARRRKCAADALGRMGGDKGLELLERAIADADPQVRDAATIALARQGDGKSLALLEKRFPDADAKVRAAVASALGGTSRDLSPEEAGMTLALLDKALADKDASVRRSAAYALPEVAAHLPAAQVDKALALIARTLDDLDGNVRGGVASALANGLGGSQADPILSLLLAQTKSRYAALRLSGSVRGEKALPLLEEAFEDPDASVRCGAVAGVAHIGGEKALALIEKALSDTSVGVRREAVRALSFGGGTKAIALLGKAMLDHDPAVRKDVVFELGLLGGEKALVLVELALADQDAAVRSKAAQVLGEFGLERSVVPLEKKLKDPDKTVRSQAFSSVITIGGPKAWAVLDKALHDSDLAARKSAADELSGFLWSELREASFDRLLGKALADPDTDVRKAVVDGLGRETAKRFKGGDSAMIAQALLKALADQDANAQGLCGGIMSIGEERPGAPGVPTEAS